MSLEKSVIFRDITNALGEVCTVVRRRVVTITDEKSIVDQTDRDWSMSRIQKKIKDGEMVNLKDGLLYTTDLGVRNLQDVNDHLEHTKNLFYQLPVDIRKLCGNDPRNFESVLLNEANHDLFYKHDLLIKRDKTDQYTELHSSIKDIKKLLESKSSDSSNSSDSFDS